MTRGDYEFQQYCEYLKEAVELGLTLSDEEQDWLDQGIIAGAVSMADSERL